MWVQLSLWDTDFISFGYIPKSGVAASYDSFIFKFLRNFNTVSHSGCTSLHSHQQSTKFFSFPHPHQHMLYYVFLMIVVLTGVRWYLIVVLICIFLMMNDVWYLSMCLFCIFFCKNIYSGPLPILTPFFKKYWAKYFRYNPYQIYGLQIFSPLP